MGLPTRQDGVENRDKVYSKPSFRRRVYVAPSSNLILRIESSARQKHNEMPVGLSFIWCS